MNILVRNKRLVIASLFALLLNLASLLNVQAQTMNLTEIIIGDGTETSCTVPFRACANGWSFWNYTESIYPSDAIGTECVIHSVSFSLAETASYSTHMTVYMGTTDEPSHTSPMGWVSPEDLTIVYDAPIEFNGQEWGKIVLDTPYHYTGGNLVIVVYAVVYSDSNVVTYGTYAEGATIVGEIYWNEGTIHNLRPNIKLEVVTEPDLIASPVAVEMGIRPNGYWAEPRKTTLISEGLSGTITSSTCDNSYFSVVSPEFPFPFAILDTIPYTIATGTGEGYLTGTFTFTYDDNKTLEIPISAEAYTPVMPDVWELPRQVTSFPYTETITSDMVLYDNYQLPGNKSDGKDVVFELTIDSDVILSTEIDDDLSGKTALYREDFEGLGGPMASNHYDGLGDAFSDCSCDFEGGALCDLGWVHNSYWDQWNVTTEDAHSGSYCMKSNNYYGNSSGSISLTINVPFDITMSFWAKVFSAFGDSPYLSNNSKGYFYIDGIAMIDGLTNGEWAYYSYNVSSGTHTFEWAHSKEYGLIGSENDCFYVDDVFFWDATTLSLKNGLQVPAGTYYMVASSTSDEFTVNINTAAIPIPEVATSPLPVDGYNCYGDETVSLSWSLGEYTNEYQVLLGETNPPNDVLVDWTNELAENHDVVTESAKTYYWRVNERNTSGITEGQVWSFSTFREIHASTDSIIYVTPTGAGIKDGSSWANAASSIQGAIDAAAAISENQPVVWVAKGNYLAHGIYQTGNGKTFCFLGHGGVKLYGGFNGDEPANYDLSQRDLENNATILDAEGHCYVVGAQSGQWDGFVMQYGGEGGFYVYDGASTAQNCKILHSEGTGVFVDGGSLDCFHNEVSYHAKDGIVQNYTWYRLDIRDCIITYNERYGVFANLCIRCQICNNGNGFYMRSSMGGAVIGCLVANNDGFGVQCDYIVNSTIVNNGTGIARTYYYSDLVLCNSILWGNERQFDEYWSWDSFYNITMANNAIQGGADGKNGIYPCIKLDDRDVLDGIQPEFVHPSSGIGSNFADGDWTLLSSSPCINMGMENLSNIPEEESFFCYQTGFTTPTDYLDYDLASNPRIMQGRIDLGAIESPYEKPNYQFPIHPDANNFIYVKEDGQGNGSSWANATSNLRDALEASVLYDSTTTIWVAQGTYTVSDFPFQVKEHLRMYGGFEGNEPADYDLSQRDLVNHASVLDGDNTLRILNQFTALSEVTAAVVDGFTIRNGNADNGAGAYLLDNMTLANCVLELNTASDKGGGIYAENAMVENCVVTNSTAQQGGGVYAEHSNLSDCFVTNNTAQQGGGMYASNSQIVQSHISNNQASIEGGGIYVHKTDLLQCNILKNMGIGIHSRIDKQDEYNHLYNTIVWGNDGESVSYSSAISTRNTFMSHCAIEGLRSTANGNIPLSHDNTGIFGPYFVDPVTEAGVTESTGDWQLQEASLCINAGSNNVSGMTMPAFDLNKMERIQHGQVDLGVYESSFDAICTEMDIREATIEEGETYDFYGTSLNETGTYEHRWTVGSCDSLVMLYLRVIHTEYIFVSEDGAGTMDGSSWTNALDGNTILENGYTKLADALQNAQCDDCFWVASGTYLPCGDSDTSKHFVLNEGVNVYGGFAGDETTLEERDLENNLTIFSGELQGDDDETNNTDGIFITAPATALWSYNATLDGLTLTKGYTPTHRGAALLVNESTAVTINQCQVHDNQEGGIYNSGKLEITASDLSNNTNNQELGDYYMIFPMDGFIIYPCSGALNNTDQGTVSLNNCTFHSNYCNNNGAIFNSGIMEINASTFEDNTADRFGTIMSPGKMKIHNTTFNNNRSEHYIAVMFVLDSLELVNCNVTNNNSNYYTSTHFPSGGAQNFPSKRTSGIEAWGYCHVTNCNFINNDAGTCPGGALTIKGEAEVENCVFRENIGQRYWRDPETGGNIGVGVFLGDPDGGALYVEGTARVTDCEFSDNFGDNGHTIGVFGGSLIMERCKVINSIAVSSLGRGAIAVLSGELTINNSLIANNSNGVICLIYGNHTYLNNTTITNTGGEAAFWFHLGNSQSTIELNNCILSGYSGLQSYVMGDNNGTVVMNNTLNQPVIGGENDPLFVNPTTYLGYDENVDPLVYDWSLQPSSPCINAGDVTLVDLDPLTTDLAGEPRVINGQVDMGAYEYGTDYMFITATANPSNGGTVMGAGAYTYGAIATLTATANEGYSFINWTKDGDVVSTDATYSFTVTEPGSYFANFVGYEITAMASPEAGGIVEGSGIYEHGATVTLSATANTGYTFINWTKDDIEVSSDEVFSFTIFESGTYVANFNQNSYTVTVISNPEASGMVTGSGTFYHGAVNTLTATPNEGYVFINWTKDGAIISTDNVYNFTVTESATYVANFCPIYCITAMAAPETGGEVDGSGVYNEGATATLTATANEYYHFVNWTKDGEEVSTDSTYCFTVTEAGIYIANFELDGHTVTAEANPTEGGTIEGDGIYPYGTIATLTATANENENYTFMYWTEDDNIVSYDAEYSFVVTLDRDLVANFSLPFTITTEANPTEGGTVTGAGVYDYGTTCTLTATPNEGYLFHNWSKDGAILSNEATYGFTVTSDDTITANFADESSVCGIVFDLYDSYGDGWNGNCLVVSDEGGILGQFTITGGYTTTYTLPIFTGSHIILTWIPGNWTNECSFDIRFENGVQIYHGTDLSASYQYEFVLDCDEATAPHTITAVAEPEEGGSIDGAGEYNSGTTCTLTATPNEGYLFYHWSNDGAILSDDPSYSFTVTSDDTITANFVEESSACEIVFDLYDSYGDGWNYASLVVTDVDGTWRELTMYSGSTASYAFLFLTGSHITLTWKAGGWDGECSFTVRYKNGTVIYEGANLNGDFLFEFDVDCSENTNYHFITPGNWNVASNWSGNTVPQSTDKVFIDATCTLDTDAEVVELTVTEGQTLTLLSGCTLTVNDTLANTVAAGLVIKDGAQLYHTSEGVFATMEKNINGFTDDGGYSLIAVPFDNSIYVPAQMTTGDYDLYQFDQSYSHVEWRNYKANAFNLTRGSGYLYANSTDMTLSLTGPIPPTSYPYSVPLTFDANSIVPGFNLVGNPFTCEAYLANGEPYFVMNSDGSGLVLAESAAIAPMKGIFIEATENQDAVTFTTEGQRGSRGQSVTLRLSDSHGFNMDAVRVRFDGGDCMEEFVLNEGATKLYIPVNGKDYSVTTAEVEGQKPIHFEAGNKGHYTLTVEVENADFAYLHLIDHKTGHIVDLLANPSYSFEASTSDLAARFTLVFDMRR